MRICTHSEIRRIGSLPVFIIPHILAFALVLLLPASSYGQFHHHDKDAAKAEAQKQDPDPPSIKPSLSIPLEPLGFSAPGELYLGARYAMTSLDFLDENHLLLTFRVPGLIERTPEIRKLQETTGEVRHIRALIIELPSGKVTAEALWTLRDHHPYVWALGNQRFLLRDGESLEFGDASLDLKPFLRFPGMVLWTEFDPSHQILVAGSQDPAPAPSVKAAHDQAANDNTPSSSSLANKETSPDASTNLVLRAFNMQNSQVLLASRVRLPVHLAFNREGYIETLRGSGADWQLNLDGFTGGTRQLVRVASSCTPSLDFLSEDILLISTCDLGSGHKIAAVTLEGRKLWEVIEAPTRIWPQLIVSGNGSRLARETLVINHEVSAFAPVGPSDVRSQRVEVYDVATGKLQLTASASPVLDIGGNAALSATGNRAAILHYGSIQVFDLPPASKQPQTPPNGGK